MKTKITLMIAFMFFGLAILHAQIKKPPLKTPVPQERRFFPLDNNLNLETIKQHIKDKKFCYVVKLSTTVIIPPEYPQAVMGITGYYSTTQYLRVERSYLRSNGLMLRSDKNYNRAQGNNYEVLIYPDASDSKKVDKNQVKLTWNSPEKGLQTFHLQNVSMRYLPYGILITGDYDIKGMVFGVSLALMPGDCLI